MGIGVKRKQRRRNGELQTFRTLASFRLHVLARLSERFYEQYYRRAFGLPLLECRIIGITGGFGQVSFKRTCEEANLDKSHASRLVNHLIKRGLVQKVSNPSDQRSVMLSLTRAGRETHRALHAAAADLSARWLSVLSAEQRRVFETSLVTLTEQIRVMTEEERGASRRRGNGKVASKSRTDPTKILSEILVDEKMARQLHRVLAMALGAKR
jgi:DNA-binding MarR family transcriptional regulator